VVFLVALVLVLAMVWPPLDKGDIRMPDIFENVGRAITAPVGNLWRGAYGGLAPAAFEKARRGQKAIDLNMELQKIRTAFDAGQFEVATQMAQNLFAEDPNIAKFIQEQMGGQLAPREGSSYEMARTRHLNWLADQETDPARAAEQWSRLRGRLAARVPEGEAETRELKSLGDFAFGREKDEWRKMGWDRRQPPFDPKSSKLGKPREDDWASEITAIESQYGPQGGYGRLGVTDFQPVAGPRLPKPETAKEFQNTYAHISDPTIAQSYWQRWSSEFGEVAEEADKGREQIWKDMTPATPQTAPSKPGEPVIPSPNPVLTPYWPQLPTEVKQKVQEALQAGLTADEIIGHLKKDGFIK